MTDGGANGLGGLALASSKVEYIPADSRERVVTFLTVPEIVALNNAMTWHKDEDSEDGMRNQLTKSYVGAKIPAFDTYPFTDKNNFEGLRWVMKAGIELQGLELSLTAGEVVSDSVTEADSVLWHLVDRGMADIAELYTAKSSKAKDTTHFCEEWEEEVPTLFILHPITLTTAPTITITRVESSPNIVDISSHLLTLTLTSRRGF